MHRFWDLVIGPLLRVAEPRSVVEVGAAGGQHTRLIAQFCAARGATLDVVEPAPRFDVAEFVARHRGAVAVHECGSLEALGAIRPFDVALLDGDHNYYTVRHELELLQRVAADCGENTPMMLCHDVCWPYGRRDLYYDPETIPPRERQPWQRAGVVPDQEALVPGGGLNAHLCNAAVSGGPRNGVLSAIEDFVAAAGEELSLTVLPVLYGLAVILPRSRARARPELEAAVRHWSSAGGLGELAELVERHRQRYDIWAQSVTGPSGGA